jgi:hypothetical protein
MKLLQFFFLLPFCLLLFTSAFPQGKDTARLRNPAPNPGAMPADSVKKIPLSAVKKGRDPHKATLYSAILPGLGQIYNRKYWKLPLVYGALGFPAYTYFYNKEWYEKTAFALAVLVNGSYLTSPDSLRRVDPKLLPFITALDNNDLINYRNEFRKDQDYSALFFLLFWGLNVIDATVDAHLSQFDVSPDLGLEIHPTIIPGTNAAGLSLVFDFHQPRPRAIQIYN